MTSLGVCTATLFVDLRYAMKASEPEVCAIGEAAVAAGFTDASVYVSHLDALGGVGLQVVAIEGVSAWAGIDDAAAEAEVERFAALVQAHGATKVLAFTTEPAVADFDAAARHLGALAERLGPLGAQVCVEFLPWSGVPDLATAWRLIEPLPPSAGIVLDMWHWQDQPGGPNPRLLGSIPGERIGYVQLCDVPGEGQSGPPSREPWHRLLPGDGIVDFPGILGILRDTGASPFFATEIFNPPLVAELGPLKAAVAMRDAALAILS